MYEIKLNMLCFECYCSIVLVTLVSYTIWMLVTFIHNRVFIPYILIDVEENFDEFLPPPLENDRF